MILFILEVVSCYPGRTAATITEGDAFSTGDHHVTDVVALVTVEGDVHQRGDIRHCNLSVFVYIGIVDDETAVDIAEDVVHEEGA